MSGAISEGATRNECWETDKSSPTSSAFQQLDFPPRSRIGNDGAYLIRNLVLPIDSLDT